jgi:hypothetical protein
VALSQDEQRILDEMERNLAAEDPRLATRLGSFGQPRLPGHLKVQHARTIGGVLALTLIAAVTVMVFVISPFANHMRNDQGPRGTPSAAARTRPTSRASASASGTAAPHSNAATVKAAKSPAAGKDAKASGGSKDVKNSATPRR